MQKKPKINWISIFAVLLFLVFLGLLLWYFFKGNVINLDQKQLQQLYANQKLPNTNDLVTSYGNVYLVFYGQTVNLSGFVKIGDKIIRYNAIISQGFFYNGGGGGLPIQELLLKLSNDGKITTSIASQAVSLWRTFLLNLLPILILIFGSFFLMMRLTKTSSGGMNPFSMGKNKAKSRNSDTKFSDVAGIKEEKFELEEIVDYLKYPQRYAQMGARTPKGVLLVGPPGTGKTLLAKAVAGEAGVPFFSISGAEFEEVFVGVGASRVREMFTAAKKAAPCIIFIDEIDAVGRKRSSASNSVNEQTLNQLLVEMDGFEPNVGIIIMAATNLRSVLDEALLRPGRFDREITLNWPDIKEREAILRLHARNKNISPRVNMYRIAERTPGFSGAQLENVLNEATLLAVRHNKKVIDLEEIDEAIDRVVGGPAKTSRVITENDKRTVSYHEAGHALLGLKLEHASKVQKVTIIPRGHAGGYTIMTPKEETLYHSKVHLRATITGYLGGRASEAIVFGETNITTGAHDDLEKATNIARRMITEFGMSDTLGLAQFENPKDSNNPFAKSAISNEIANKIDQEIKRILDECYQEAHRVILQERETLDLIAISLMTLETITAEQIEYIDKNTKLPPEVIEMQKQTAATIKNKKAKTTAEDNSIDENDHQPSVEETDDAIKVKPSKK